MLKIQRFADEDSVVLVLSGRIESENVTQLESLISAESKPVSFDLGEVNLVSREVVKFLVHCEKNGVKIRNCPSYIREWIARE